MVYTYCAIVCFQVNYFGVRYFASVREVLRIFRRFVTVCAMRQMESDGNK